MSICITLWSKDTQLPRTRQLARTTEPTLKLWDVEWMVTKLRALPFDPLELWVFKQGRWDVVTFGNAEVELTAEANVLLVRPVDVRRCINFGAELHAFERLTGSQPAVSLHERNDYHVLREEAKSGLSTVRVILWDKDSADPTMFKTYQIASLPLRLATFTNRCAKHSDADIKACGMWDTMFQQAVALATWDVDSTEWTVKNPEDFIDLEHDVRIVLIKFLDVNITPGLGEVLMVMDRQRLDAGEDILPDEDASESDAAGNAVAGAEGDEAYAVVDAADAAVDAVDAAGGAVGDAGAAAHADADFAVVAGMANARCDQDAHGSHVVPGDTSCEAIGGSGKRDHDSVGRDRHYTRGGDDERDPKRAKAGVEDTVEGGVVGSAPRGGDVGRERTEIEDAPANERTGRAEESRGVSVSFSGGGEGAPGAAAAAAAAGEGDADKDDESDQGTVVADDVPGYMGGQGDGGGALVAVAAAAPDVVVAADVNAEIDAGGHCPRDIRSYLVRTASREYYDLTMGSSSGNPIELLDDDDDDDE